MRLARSFKQFRRPRVFLPLLVILVLIIGTVAIIRNLNAPAVGSINQTPPAQAAPTDPYAQPGTYTGKYISFKYPAHFKKVPSKLTGESLEVVDYHSTDLSGKLISIEVEPGSIATSSDVQFRRQQAGIYKETDSRIGAEFVKTDGTEDTFFIEHAGLLASVSASAPNGGLNGEAFFVASGLKWR